MERYKEIRELSGENRDNKSDLHLTESDEYILRITKAIRCLIRRPAKRDGRPPFPARPAPDFNYNTGLFTLILGILHSLREPRKGQAERK